MNNAIFTCTLPTRALSLVVAVALAVFALPSHAQFGASVSGSVQDDSGALIPGATVTLTNSATKQAKTQTTDSSGIYTFSEIGPGSYTVVATAPHFSSGTVDNVAVSAESPRTVNVTLKAGSASETVTVNADTIPVLQTADPSIGRTIDAEEIRRLPTFGSNPYELLRTAPGITGDAARGGNGTANFLPNNQGVGGSNSGVYQTENQTQISANGQRVTNNNYMIDGVSVNSLSHGGSAVVTPNTEAVSDITVISTSYDAGDGRNTGAQIKTVTRNGTNQLHGSVRFLYDEPGLNAYNKWGGPTNGPRLRVSNKQRTYAASLGGPIVKDKLFLFGSYQGFGQGNNGTSVGWVETSQYRSSVITNRPGGVTALLLSSPGVQPRIVTALDRGCEDYAAQQGNFPGQTALSGLWCRKVSGGIDIGSLTPGGASQTGVYPAFTRPQPGSPNCPTGSASCPSPEDVGGGLDGIPDLQYVQLSVPSHSRGQQFNGRVDYNLTQKDLLAGSTYFTKLDSYGSANVNSRPQGDNAFKPLNSSGTLIYIHTFSPTVINELRGNFTRFFDNGLKDGGGIENFGLPESHTEALPVNQIQFGLPQGVGAFFAQNQYELRDTVSKVFGAHNLRMGIELRREQDNDNTVIARSRPLYSSRGLWNLANGTPIFEQIIANPKTGGAPTFGNHLRSEYYGAFAQHDWKATSQLTINTGLRWELFTPLRNKDFALLYPQLGGPGRELTDLKLVPKDPLWNTQYGLFSPKVGFAWNPTAYHSKMVVRGGFAMAYNHLDFALFNPAQEDNGPGVASYGLCCGTPTDWFSTPFAGNTITYVAGTSNSPTSYPINPALATGIGPSGFPNSFNGVNPNTTAYGALPNTKVPYSYLYSLETEFQLPAQFTATVGYAGSVGRHYARIVYQAFIYDPSKAPGGVFMAQTDSNLSYNSMNLRLEHHLHNGITGAVNYTYSKDLDQVSNGDQANSLANQTNPAHNETEWGPSDYDTKHRITGSALWELPHVHSDSALVKAAANGWQLNGIVTYHTGFPWTPVTNNLNSVPLTPTSATINPVRPLAYLGGAGSSCSSSAFQNGTNFPNGGPAYFNTTLPKDSKGNPITTAYVPGIGRNSFRGPCYFGVDMSAAKEVKFELLGHNTLFRFQANALNVFNVLTMQPIVNGNSGSGANISSATFGKSNGANAGRVIDFEARLQF